MAKSKLVTAKIEYLNIHKAYFEESLMLTIAQFEIH